MPAAIEAESSIYPKKAGGGPLGLVGPVTGMVVPLLKNKVKAERCEPSFQSMDSKPNANVSFVGVKVIDALVSYEPTMPGTFGAFGLKSKHGVGVEPNGSSKAGQNPEMPKVPVPVRETKKPENASPGTAVVMFVFVVIEEKSSNVETAVGGMAALYAVRSVKVVTVWACAFDKLANIAFTDIDNKNSKDVQYLCISESPPTYVYRLSQFSESMLGYVKTYYRNSGGHGLELSASIHA